MNFEAFQWSSLSCDKLTCQVPQYGLTGLGLALRKSAEVVGKSDVFLQGLVSGSAGVIGALPNVVPKLHKRLWNLYQDGNLVEAQKVQALLGQADWELGKLGSIAGIKALVSQHFGYGQPYVKGPLAPIFEVDATKVSRLLEAINLEKSLYV